MRFSNSRRWLRGLLLVSLMAAGAAQAGGRFVFISHAPDSDSWWNTVRNSLKQAAGDFDARVDYRNPPTGDIADMARLIEQAAAQNYDGVITTVADFDVLQGALRKVTDKKIPLITANSGTAEQSEQLGAVMHVGQGEYEAGRLAGERAKAAGVKSFVCVNHYDQSGFLRALPGLWRGDWRRFPNQHHRYRHRSGAGGEHDQCIFAPASENAGHFCRGT